LILGQPALDTSSHSDKENSLPTSSPDFIDNPNRKPSYLKLSCAVSGYGKYSR
jgi:hypothetical protein